MRRTHLSRLREGLRWVAFAAMLGNLSAATGASAAPKTEYRARLSNRGPELIFKVALDRDWIPTGISVYREREAAPIQTLANRCQSSKEVFPVQRYPSLELVKAVDLNFDGYRDLELVAYANAPHLGNTFYCAWLWDPASQRFLPLSALDEASDPTPDPKTRTITSRRFYTGGPEQEEVYSWIGGRLVLSESRRLYYGSSVAGCNHYVVEKRQGDRMVTVRDQLAEPALGGIKPCHAAGAHPLPARP